MDTIVVSVAEMIPFVAVTQMRPLGSLQLMSAHGLRCDAALALREASIAYFFVRILTLFQSERCVMMRSSFNPFFLPFAARELENSMVGTLPYEIALLTDLTTFIAEGNRIFGSIPESWSVMSTLETLRLGLNQLTGTFPEQLIENNGKLDTIRLGGNRLVGTIPSSLATLQLEDLRLEKNQFTGTIPSEFGSLTKLRKSVPVGIFCDGDCPKLCS